MAVCTPGSGFWQIRTMGHWNDWHKHGSQISWADLSQLVALPTFQAELTAVRNVGPESAALFMHILAILRGQLWNL